MGRFAVIFILCLEPLRFMAGEPSQSPRSAELFPVARAILPPIGEPVSILPSAAFAPDPVSDLVTNSFTWTGSAGADGYTLYQGTNSGGPYCLSYHSAGAETNLTIVFSWPESVERFYFVATAFNELGESRPSRELAVPSLPPTHVILTWSGPGRANIFETTTLVRPVWWLLTNAPSPVILPIQPGAHFFGAGTNKLSITATNF